MEEKIVQEYNTDNGRFHQKNRRNIQRKRKTLRDRRKNQIANAKFSNKPCGDLY